MGTTISQSLRVEYWIESVSLFNTNYDLISASVAGLEQSPDHRSAHWHVVYCALRNPLPAQGERKHEQYLADLSKSLRHAGTIQLTSNYAANQETVRQVLEYLAGQRRDFDLPLQLMGTAFQKKVWSELLKIPYGTTKCYADIAQAVGNPWGARAVGMANNRNPVSLIVPCHRVIGKNGQLVGYGGGLDIKTHLLSLEKSDLS